MSEDTILAAIARLTDQVVEGRAETARLSEQVADVRAETGRLSEQVADVRAETARLSEQIGQSRAETARLIEGVQTSVNSIRDDIAVNSSANDRTRRTGENTRDELRDLASGVANIERVLLKHGTRLDALEQRTPPT